MEREKNERLTAREIEEEEMKRELTGIGIYEPGITYKQMKRLLEFVNESQDTSNVTSNNKNTEENQHFDNECLSDVTADMQQEATLQEYTEVPRSSYSYKNRTSPTIKESKTVRYARSESPSLFERKSVYRRKSSDSDELFEKPYDGTNSMHSTNRYPLLKPENISRECQNVTEKRMMQDAQQDEVQKLERWRLNPLDVNINENDVPLPQPKRLSSRERMPFELCKKAHTPDQREQIKCLLSQHLKDMTDLWYSWRPITNTPFQWGSPIQVGAVNDNWDKKSLTDSKTEQKAEECTYRDGHERASKRKASTLIIKSNRDSSEDEGNNRYDFIRIKKKRVQSNGKSSDAACTTNRSNTNKKTALNANADHSCSDDNIDVDTENERVLFQKRTSEKTERVSSPELVTYPRRIPPPNPKTRLSLTKQKRGNAVSKSSPKMRRTNENKVTAQTRGQKKNTGMTTEEIRQNIEEDWTDNEEDDEKDVEIRPLPISREMRTKLRNKRLLLTKSEKEAAKEDENDEEQVRKKRPRLREQREKKETRIESTNGSWEHELLSDNENQSSEVNQKAAQSADQPTNESSTSKNVSCPICNKYFPHDEIEDHAADCDQFEINNEEDINDQLECNICSNYKTNNGMKYEEHVQQCINNGNNQRHSDGSEDTNTTSTSSFRTFIPISEQKNSEIDYLGQLRSNNRKRMNVGRKKRR